MKSTDSNLCAALIASALLLLTAAQGKIGETRTWTDNQGRQIQAKLIKVDDARVILEIKGVRYTMSLSKFSEADQRYAESMRPQPPAGEITECPISPPAELATWLKENHMESLEWNGVARPGAEPLRLPFQLHVPPDAGKGAHEELPIIVHLHGTGGIGKDNLKQWEDGGGAAKLFMSEDLQKHEPCYVMIPQCARMSGWYALSYTDPSQEMRAIVHAIGLMMQGGKYHIDASRIYVTGLSMGGAGAFQAMAKFPGFFAAAVPIAYVDTPKIFNAENCGPIWVVINSGDHNYEERLEAFKSHYRDVGGTIKTTIYEQDGHNAWTQLLSDRKFRQWLFRR